MTQHQEEDTIQKGLADMYKHNNGVGQIIVEAQRKLFKMFPDNKREITGVFIHLESLLKTHIQEPQHNNREWEEWEKRLDELEAEVMDWFYETVKINFSVDMVQDSSDLRVVLEQFIKEERVATAKKTREEVIGEIEKKISEIRIPWRGEKDFDKEEEAIHNKLWGKDTYYFWQTGSRSYENRVREILISLKNKSE